MNKGLLLLLILSVITCFVCGQTKVYTINGILNDAEKGERINLYKWKEDLSFHLIDSTVYNNGFTLSNSLGEISYVMVKRDGSNKRIYFVLDEGTTKITENNGIFNIQGGKQASYNQEADSIDQMYFRQYRKLIDTANSYKERNPKLYQQYRDSANNVYQQGFDVLEAYFLARPDAFAGLLHLMGFKSFLEHEAMTRMYNNLTDELKSYSFGKVIKQYIEAEKNDYAYPITNQIDIGKATVNISFPTGNYVIIDFWASWCTPCRKNNVHLSALYNEYHTKGLDMISVSSDSDLAAWKAAVVKDEMVWANVSDLKGWANAYLIKNGVKSLPTYLVIDPKGKIILKTTNIAELKDFVSKIFKGV